MERIYYLEIGPLKEPNYTGVAQVTAALAKQMLDDASRETFFFFGRALVDRTVVRALVEEQNGDLLEWHVKRSSSIPAPFGVTGKHIAIFPNKKTCRRAFDYEVQIIHDLTPIITPQYHHRDTIDFHASSYLPDYETNDLTVCVSDATRSDVITYLGSGEDEHKLVTIHNAVYLDPSWRKDLVIPYTGMPYILILGTIEPRKNIEKVLAFIQESPGILDRYRFIFLGRFGWGDAVEKLVSRFNLEDKLKEGAIFFPGFINEHAKYELIMQAHCLIYPSLFEGFGLPILEALSFGTPCITTHSSSLPEAGGDACFYFDPFSEADFRNVFSHALAVIEQNRSSISSAAILHATSFSWERSYGQLMREIDMRIGEGE